MKHLRHVDLVWYSGNKRTLAQGMSSWTEVNIDSWAVRISIDVCNCELSVRYLIPNFEIVSSRTVIHDNLFLLNRWNSCKFRKEYAFRGYVKISFDSLFISLIHF